MVPISLKSDELKESKRLILITSDVSTRGMNYPDVTLVIQVLVMHKIVSDFLFVIHVNSMNSLAFGENPYLL